MGRLTLNVLLSFAQFERELSSERVRDKFAASRKKGKWMGGSVPLGFDVKDKRLVINETEAKTVRYIFHRYLELRSFRLLTNDLQSKRITTKKRLILEGKTAGGIRFAYGSLAYLLKNRIYVGEAVHRGTTFPGEQEAILDRKTFDKVQTLLKGNSIRRSIKRSGGDDILRGYLFDDHGNRMSPSFSTKKGVRYRFYVSSALLRGMADKAGSLPRVSAPQIESRIVAELSSRLGKDTTNSERSLVESYVERIIISKDKVRVALKGDITGVPQSQIEIQWQAPFDSSSRIEGVDHPQASKRGRVLIQAIVRAHGWLRMLEAGRYSSIEELGTAVGLHPKMIREMLRLVFLAPNITTAILRGEQPTSLNLRCLKKTKALSWSEQNRILAFGPPREDPSPTARV